METLKITRKIWMLAFAAVLAFMTSCSKDFDIPPVEVPKFTLPEGATLISIQDLIARHLVAGALDSINDNVYVTGIITANDKSGNFYKQLFFQDSTAGIYIGLDRTSLYNLFQVGQRIYVKCKGLFLGDYGGMIQLGAPYNGAIGRIADIDVGSYVFRDSLPGAAPAATLLTIPTLADGQLGKLIRLEGVSIQEVGQPFAISTATTNRTISDGTTNTLILRTSNYADFAASLIPGGTGNIVGILSIYNGDYQLMIRDLNDLSGFDYSSQMFINEAFATSGSLGTFSQYSVTGAQVWAQSTYGSATFAKMSGYSGGSYYANEDWLISPAANFDDYNGETLNFFTMMNYGTAGDGSLKVYYSTDYVSGAPSTGTWTEITGLTLSGGSFANVPSGNVDVSFINGTNVHIAFVYTCSTTNVATWELGGIQVKGSHI